MKNGSFGENRKKKKKEKKNQLNKLKIMHGLVSWEISHFCYYFGFYFVLSFFHHLLRFCNVRGFHSLSMGLYLLFLYLSSFLSIDIPKPAIQREIEEEKQILKPKTKKKRKYQLILWHQLW